MARGWRGRGGRRLPHTCPWRAYEAAHARRGAQPPAPPRPTQHCPALPRRPQQARRRAAVVRDRIPLHHFLRLIAPHRLVEHGAAASNDDLVQNLKRAGAITT